VIGGGCAPPTLTRLGNFFRLDGVYARKWQLSILCLLCFPHPPHSVSFSLIYRSYTMALLVSPNRRHLFVKPLGTNYEYELNTRRSSIKIYLGDNRMDPALSSIKIFLNVSFYQKMTHCTPFIHYCKGNKSGYSIFLYSYVLFLLNQCAQLQKQQVEFLDIKTAENSFKFLSSTISTPSVQICTTFSWQSSRGGTFLFMVILFKLAVRGEKHSSKQVFK